MEIARLRCSAETKAGAPRFVVILFAALKVHASIMADAYSCLVELTPRGIPWLVDPQARTFLLPNGDQAVHGLVLPAGTPFSSDGAKQLGTSDTAKVAAGLEGSDEAAIVGSRVRYEIQDKKFTDRKRHEIHPGCEADMKRNGLRLLELIDAAADVAGGSMTRLQAIVREFPSVAFRHERIASVLDRMGVSHEQIRRWFGLIGGRGRPARSIPDARTLVGTFAHERATSETVEAALARVAGPASVTSEHLANISSREGELYELSVGGIWVTADHLQRIPWVAPQVATLQWDVYRLPT